MTIVGIISDTHGLLRSEASNRLRGCDIIIHAGDIGSPDVIDQLELVAPVRAIRGNIDALQRNGIRIPVGFFLCVAWRQAIHGIIPSVLVIWKV